MTNPARKLLNPKVLERILSKTPLSRNITYKPRVTRLSDADAEEVVRLREMAAQSLISQEKLSSTRLN